MKNALLLLVLMLLTAGWASGQDINLVANGDFSAGVDGLDNWSAAGAITLGDDTAPGDKAWVTPALFGGAFADVLIIQASSSNDGNGRGITQQFGLGDAEAYMLSFKYGYTNIGSYSTITINWRDAADAPIAGKWFQWSFDWTTEPDPNPSDAAYSNSSGSMLSKAVTLTRGEAPDGNSGVIPSDAVYGVVTLKQHYTGYRSYFDDVVLEPVGVRNGSFSEGTSPYGLDQWEASGDITLVDAASAANSTCWVYPSFWGGAYTDVLAIQSSGGGGTGEGVQQYIAIGDATRYVLRYKYGFTNIGSYSTVNLSWRDAAGNPIAGAGWFQQAFDWTDNWGNEDHNPNDTAYSNSSPGLVSKVIDFRRGDPVAGNSTIVPTTARYAYISLKQHYVGYRTYFDEVSFDATNPQCGDEGTYYLAGDLTEDCYVTMDDLSKFAERWMQCSDPCDAACDEYWK